MMIFRGTLGLCSKSGKLVWRRCPLPAADAPAMRTQKCFLRFPISTVLNPAQRAHGSDSPAGNLVPCTLSSLRGGLNICLHQLSQSDSVVEGQGNMVPLWGLGRSPKRNPKRTHPSLFSSGRKNGRNSSIYKSMDDTVQ